MSAAELFAAVAVIALALSIGLQISARHCWRVGYELVDADAARKATRWGHICNLLSSLFFGLAAASALQALQS